MFRHCATTAITSLLVLLIGVLSINLVGAQVMSSSNYQINSDSINVGGGFSTSTNYQLESTAGEIASGESSSATYILKAGYQQMDEVYIAITPVADVSMGPTIPGATGGVADGAAAVRVTTDSRAGYQLTIKALNDPAMQKGADTIADYVPVGAPDYTFVTATDDAHFGYTPEGSDVVDRFLDDGGACNTGSSETTLACWDGLSTTAATIASGNSSNHPSGATTTIRFRVGIGSGVVQAPGVYAATTTVTATAL